MSEPSFSILQGDTLELMRAMPGNSVDLIATDPPYFRVKDEAWDRQWDDPDAFLSWIAAVADEWQRILRPNGSLYCFASPKMAARVEEVLRQRFNILNRIAWRKYHGNEGGPWRRAKKESLRRFFEQKEEIIFAEHIGADNMAKGEAGYRDERGLVFEPLRAYLAGEWERAGLSTQDANKATGTLMAGHYFGRSQWCLPTESNYLKLREYANRNGGDYLTREYADLLAELEAYRLAFEAARRPFAVTRDVPYTDVWDFPTVGHYKGKHPCEKPISLMRHIITTSSRPGDVVFDSFAGSGVTGEAAVVLGRNFIGHEKDPHWAAVASRRGVFGVSHE